MKDIQQILENYSEVANELGNVSTKMLIDEFIEKNANQRYEIPLIGQFSSGKSATLNHLLGRDLLPTKSIETTAFATFISYSESEYAELELEDGTFETVTFEEIKKLDNNKVAELGKSIKTLNIGINSEILKNGLTLVDTPGVNTIITSHIEITERILKSAQCVVYVTAKNITDKDALMISTIESNNIPILFVRTHIDDIKKTEENCENTIQENQRSIEEKLGHPIQFFAISNDVSRIEFEGYFIKLKDYISNTIANNVRDVFDKAVMQRLIPIGKELETAISICEQTLRNNVRQSLADIEKQKSKIENLVLDWNTKLKYQQEYISKRAGELKSEIKDTVTKLTDSKINDFKTDVNNLESDVVTYDSCVKTHISKASKYINGQVESMIQLDANSVCRRIGEKMMSIGNELEAIGIGGDCFFDMSVARDYSERQNKIDREFEEQVATINEIKAQVALKTDLSEQERDKFQQAILNAENEIKAYKENINSIENAYEPQYVEKQSKLGPIGEKVGNVLDIAMLLIPGPQWAKGGKWISKIGQKGSLLRTVGKTIGKGAKIVSKTDAAKDAATLIGGLKNVNDKLNGNLKKTSIFDYVSLSYWLGKAGESIDPTTTELDLEYEQEFEARKNLAQQELKSALNQKMAIINNLSRLNGEKWKAEQESIAAEQMEQELVKETKIIKSNLETEKNIAVRKSLISQAEKQFEQRICEYVAILISRSTEMVETVYSSIINSADMKIKNQLDSLKDQLNDILNNQEEYIANRNQKIKHYEELAAKLVINR